MADGQKYPNSGILFRNENRTKATSPNATGTANVGGVEYNVSAWTREGKNGSKFQTLSFTPKQKG